MRTITILISVVFLCLGNVWGDQASLDALVKKEQANVDNEAVSVYGGTVGKLEAVFFIEWNGAGNPIDGEYYYVSRGKDRRYVLKGSNPEDGVLVLQEYTPRENGPARLTATCRLKKKVTKSRIVWEGRMENTDGKAFKMVFSRKR